MIEVAILVCNFLSTISLNLLTGALLLGPVLRWLGRSDANSARFKAGCELLSWIQHLLPLLVSLSGIYLLNLYLHFCRIYEVYNLSPSILIGAATLIIFGIPMQLIARKQKLPSSKHPLLNLILFGLSTIFSIVAFYMSDMVTFFFHETGLNFVFSSLVQSFLYLRSDPFTQAGYLHFLLASFAVTGLAVGYQSLLLKQKREPSAIKLGAGLYVLATLMQAPVGGYYFNLIPLELARRINGADMLASSNFLFAMVTMTASFVFMCLATKTAKEAHFTAGFYTALATIFSMLYTRYELRTLKLEHYLAPTADPDTFVTTSIICCLTLIAALDVFLVLRGQRKVK